MYVNSIKSACRTHRDRSFFPLGEALIYLYGRTKLLKIEEIQNAGENEQEDKGEKTMGKDSKGEISKCGRKDTLLPVH